MKLRDNDIDINETSEPESDDFDWDFNPEGDLDGGAE